MLESDGDHWTAEFMRRLGPKEVCLTFDDGPGDPPPRGWTVPIAEFLHGEGISGTFFVVGQRIEQPGGREALAKMRDMGHLIGNHTVSHPNLIELLNEGENRVVRELVDTHYLIRDFVGDRPLVFRAPFGAWNERVWKAIKSEKELEKYHGPLSANICCFDWDLGRERDGVLWTLAHCQGNLLGRLQLMEKGVILLHDSSAGKVYGEVNHRRDQLVYELTKWLVQWLKREKYKFIGLDELVSRPSI